MRLLTLSLLFISCFASSLPSKVKLIIDTDGVYDDIRALTIALLHPNVQVLAITTVHGGVTANQSAANVARLLRATKQEHIPIYIGSQDSLIPKGPIVVWEELFGSDGIGGVPNCEPKSVASDFQQPHGAVEAILDITERESNVTIVALGPLTNIALALRKDPELSWRIKSLVIMGGNYMGVGNTMSNSTAEFNFLMDPEAAHIVLSALYTTIVPWDTCFFKGPEYSESVDYEESLHQRTPLSYFLSNITARGREYNKQIHQQYAFVDDVAVAIAIDSRIAAKSMKLCASVELERSAVTRGQVTVDWLGTGYNTKNQAFEAVSDKNDQNWLAQNFVTEYDVRMINELLVAAVRKTDKTK